MRSWLLELLGRAFASEGQDLAHLKGWVADSGEGRWTVQEAIDRDVPAPVITLSLRRASAPARTTRTAARSSPRCATSSAATRSRRSSRGTHGSRHGHGHPRGGRHGAEPEDLPAPRGAGPDVRRELRRHAPAREAGETRPGAGPGAVGHRQLRRPDPRLHGRGPGIHDRAGPRRLAGRHRRLHPGRHLRRLAGRAGPGGPRPRGPMDGVRPGLDVAGRLGPVRAARAQRPVAGRRLLQRAARADRGGHPRRRQPHPAQHERRPDRDRRPERAAARRGGGGQRADRHRRRRPRRHRLRDPGRGAVHREDLGPQGRPGPAKANQRSEGAVGAAV